MSTTKTLSKERVLVIDNNPKVFDFLRDSKQTHRLVVKIVCVDGEDGQKGPYGQPFQGGSYFSSWRLGGVIYTTRGQADFHACDLEVLDLSPLGETVSTLQAASKALSATIKALRKVQEKAGYATSWAQWVRHLAMSVKADRLFVTTSLYELATGSKRPESGWADDGNGNFVIIDLRNAGYILHAISNTRVIRKEESKECETA